MTEPTVIRPARPRPRPASGPRPRPRPASGPRPRSPASDRVLMVVSTAATLQCRDGSELATGYWASEVLDCYQVLTFAGLDVLIATPGARAPRADECSLGDDELLAEQLRAIPGLAEPASLADVVDVTDVAGVVLPGGHGPMQDLYADHQLGRILRAALDAQVPIAAICHGAAGLLSVRQDPEARWPFAGRAMTAFSDAEEAQAGFTDRLRWSLESELRAAGAAFESAPEPFAEHVVVDGLLVTGQNPASSKPVAEALLRLLPPRARG